MFIEANPEFKVFNICDLSMKKVYQEHEKKEIKPEKVQGDASDKMEEQRKKLIKNRMRNL